MNCIRLPLKKIVIWGASLSGEDCFRRYLQQGVKVKYFVDRKALPGDTFCDRPLYPVDFLLNDKISDFDAIILAMGADSSGPKRVLKEAGVNKPVIPFRQGAQVTKHIERYISPNLCFLDDESGEDSYFIDTLYKHVIQQDEYLIIDSSNNVIQHLYRLYPDAKSRIRDLSEISGSDVPVRNILITATTFLDIQDKKARLTQQFPDAKLVTFSEVISLNSTKSIPDRFYVDLPKSIYPITVPSIILDDDLDFALFDLPPRFFGMMPNGLGYVHNCLEKIGIKLQTLDLDIIFYHRYHSSRIFDGKESVITSAGYEMKQDPWSVDVITDEWEKQQVLDYFQPEIDQLVDEIIRAKPKIIGFSLHGLNLKISEQVVKRIREGYPDAIIVVGGYDCIRPEFGGNLFHDFDYMVIFEAEMSLPGLVSDLLAGKRPKNRPGIISKFDRPELPFVPAPLFEDLDSIAFPKYQWCDLSIYRNYNGAQQTPLVLSRGCRWSRCTFCAERFTWRRRSPDKVVDEIQWLVDRGRDTFVFNDSDLSGDPQAVRAICDEIIRRDIHGITLSGQLRVQKGYTQDYFDTLKRAGFNSLTYGIDGWSKNTLKLHKKGYTVGMIEEVLKYTSNAGINIGMNLVIGIPHETEEDIDETIANIINNKKHIDSIANLNTLILSNGSLYWERPDDFGIRFNGNKEEIFRENIKMIPYHLWYSEGPYIDQNVRLERVRRIVEELSSEGIVVGSYSEWNLTRIQEQ